jgi:hypothetical protein
VSTTKPRLYGGLGIIIGGGVFSIYSVYSDPYSSAKLWAGLGVIGIGTFVHILGYGPRNILTVGQAQKIADEHNQALLEEIFGEGE